MLTSEPYRVRPRYRSRHGSFPTGPKVHSGSLAGYRSIGIPLKLQLTLPHLFSTLEVNLPLESEILRMNGLEIKFWGNIIK